jgi:hypothetical protein
MPEPHLRAADSDRTAVATVLGQAMSEGRLTVDEYDERLGRAYAASTLGELAPLTADLPRAARATEPRVAPPASAPTCGRGEGGQHPGDASSWRSWLGTALIVLTVWTLLSLGSAEVQYFWPFWVIVPWGGVLLVGTLARHGRARDRRSVEPVSTPGTR